MWISNVTLTLPDWMEEELAAETSCETAEEQMALAIRLAARNVAEGTGGPFGAAIFESERATLVSVGVNRVVSTCCAVAHAEAMAIMLAQQRVRSYDLACPDHPPVRLVSSAQPCAQCYGMIWWSGVRELVSGATAEDVERLTGFSEGPLPEHWVDKLSHREGLPSVQVTQEVLREEALAPLIEYAKQNGPVYSPSSA